MENKRIEESQEGDIISRQAAIDALEREKTYCTAFREGYTPINVFEKYNAGLTDGIKALKNLPSAQPEPKWIPCSERLPEEETDVLICNANGDIAISRGSYSTEAEDDFIWYTSGWRFGKVIAWMPLPDPYEGE